MTENDPDETEGRKLYRAIADRLAREQIAMGTRQIVYHPIEARVVDTGGGDER